jgi:hypothetical protein
MTTKRQETIRTEAQRRLNEWLENSTFDEMSVGGSKMRFDMSLGLFQGYPFIKPDWMKTKNFNGFVSEEELNSKEYDVIIDQLFNSQLDLSLIEDQSTYSLHWFVAVLERDLNIKVKDTVAFQQAKLRQMEQLDNAYERGYEEGRQSILNQ